MESEANIRVTRRTVGHVAARLAEIGLDEVADPRVGKVKWKLRDVLTACLVGMAAGCKGLGEVEVSATPKKRPNPVKNAPTTAPTARSLRR